MIARNSLLPTITPLPRKPRLPTTPHHAPAPAFKPFPVGQADTDEFGLDTKVFGAYCTAIRKYIAKAYEFFHLDKRVAPTHQLVTASVNGSGTIPEMVTVGGLLERGFTYGGHGTRSFAYQSQALGGRIPGGAVVDVLVIINARHIGVRVQSIFHAPTSPFSGLAKVEEDERQRLRLLATVQIDAVVDVNRDIDGYPLEQGPDPMVEREFDRIMERV